MSRIGKKSIEIPAAVKVVMEGQVVKVTGAKGELTQEIHRDITVESKDGKVFVMPRKEGADKKAKALWGLYRALIANMVEGVSKGFEKKLEIEGVGFKAAVQGDELVMSLGFSHPVKIKKIPEVTFTVEKNVITVAGINKERVGYMAAEIRKQKKVEPYKGKGIRYQGDIVRR